MTLTWISAWLLGVFGGVHCASMCGGIVALLGSRGTARPCASAAPAGATSPRATSPRATSPRATSPRALSLALAYNTGRIGSYMVAGALAGGVGSAAWLAEHVLPIQRLAFVAANLVLIALGLALSGALRGGLGRLRVLERLGLVAWRRIAPAATRLLGAPGLPGALAAGAAWGWVPCGMVYGLLAAAIVSGSAADGALLMLAFGLGTLPNLLVLGLTAGHASRWLAHAGARAFAGALIVLFGVAGLARIDPLARLHDVADACLQWVR